MSKILKNEKFVLMSKILNIKKCEFCFQGGRSSGAYLHNPAFKNHALNDASRRGPRDPPRRYGSQQQNFY